MTRTRITTLAALLLAALLMAGCGGGGGGGEPTVTQTLHDELQAELDAALANLKKEQDAKQGEADAREMAETEAKRLRGELETATDNVTRLTDELATATIGVGRLTAQLATANNNVESLTDRIGTADDADSLQGMLAAEKARVTTLMNQIGSADDAASDAEGASLHAQLKAANEEVTRLTGELGTATDMADAAGSLHAQLAAEKAKVTTLTNQIGTATDTANAAESASLYAQLKAAKAKVTELTGEIGDTITPNSLKARLATAQARVTALEGTLDNANDQVSRLTQDLATARGERDIARQRADNAEDERDTARGQAQGLEANQRAEKLLKVLEAFTPADPGGSGRVAISVPSKNNLTFKQSDYTPRPLSASGLRGAKLTRTQGGTQTTVVYTDIELSRSLIKNYVLGADATTLDLPLDGVLADHRTNYLADEDAVEITSHGFRSSRRFDTDGNPKEDSNNDPLDPLTKTGASFSGKLHGISGTFQCSNDCTLTATYSAENRLTKLVLSAVADVRFKPGRLAATTASTAMVSLCDAPLSACAPTDADYMVFGYWRSEPADVQGTYQFEAFAFGPVLGAAAPNDATPIAPAEYNGTAVGMYVEQNQVGAAVTKKQGEFIADARLAYDGSDLTGTIDDFATTPTGGSSAPTTTGWVVKLNSGELTEFQRLGPDGMGTWKHRYTADKSAVVGTFESALEDVLHIAGAFGAKRQQ